MILTNGLKTKTMIFPFQASRPSLACF